MQDLQKMKPYGLCAALQRQHGATCAKPRQQAAHLAIGFTAMRRHRLQWPYGVVESSPKRTVCVPYLRGPASATAVRVRRTRPPPPHHLLLRIRVVRLGRVVVRVAARHGGYGRAVACEPPGESTRGLQTPTTGPCAAPRRCGGCGPGGGCTCCSADQMKCRCPRCALLRTGALSRRRCAADTHARTSVRTGSGVTSVQVRESVHCGHAAPKRVDECSCRR